MAVSDISTRSFQIWIIPPNEIAILWLRENTVYWVLEFQRHNRKYLKELIYEGAKQQDAVYIGTTERYLCVKHTPLHYSKQIQHKIKFAKY